MRRDELEVLERRGVAFDAAIGRLVEWVDDEAWKDDVQLALDAQPATITAANAGVPAFLTNYMDPEVVRVITAPMRATEIAGEMKMGDWTTFSAEFPLVESTGEVSSYGDANNNGSAGFNVNWIPRQSYHYQVVAQWGEREVEKYGKARIGYVSEVNIAAALVMNKFQNRSYFFGVSGLRNYGLLNDPDLLAPITPGVKAAGGLTWSVATMNEIYADVLRLFRQLQTQMGGVLAPDMSVSLTLAVSPSLATYLKTANTFAPSFTAEQLIQGNFPGLKVKTAPEYSTASGELMQLILNDVDGVTTARAAFTEKMRNHAVVVDLSSWRQKKSAGTWGTIVKRPIAIAQMLGM